MQAITIAISPAGIQYFTQQLIVQRAEKLLAGLTPPSRKISIPDICRDPEFWKNISIDLNAGVFKSFSLKYDRISQLPGTSSGKGLFALTFKAPAFTVLYTWRETYTEIKPNCDEEFCFPPTKRDRDETAQYQPSFNSLTVNLNLTFSYQDIDKNYAIQFVNSTSSTENANANIPGGSVLNNQEASCFSSKVSDATAAAMSTIDYATELNPLLHGMFATIPASGKLTENISYDFRLGSSGLTFPNNSGIAIGVTGNAMYKGNSYAGTEPQPLPLPPIPGEAETHHLNVYVSSFAVNALYWAFYQDGKLTVNLTPGDLGADAPYLRIKQYENAIQAFKPYTGAAIYAVISPKTSPVAVFQQIYEFTPSVMAALQSNANIPDNVKQLLADSFGGTAYLDKADLETNLQGANIDASYFPFIETAALMSGMVMSQTLEFVLTIQHGSDPKPNLVFDVTRTDIMTNLALGTRDNKAQTMQFDFMNVTSKTAATFVSTTVPKFDKKDFGNLIWPLIGEPAYLKVMQDVGSYGVPIPIMQGFKFLFEQAKLTVQPGADSASGYVSILANVELQHQTLPVKVQNMLAMAE